MVHGVDHPTGPCVLAVSVAGRVASSPPPPSRRPRRATIRSVINNIDCRRSVSERKRKRPPPVTADAVIAMSGLAKLFVGDVVEHARTAYGETLSDGALDPDVVRASARDIFEQQGLL